MRTFEGKCRFVARAGFKLAAILSWHYILLAVASVAALSYNCGKIEREWLMRGKVFVFGGAILLIIIAALVEQHATAQATRTQVPLFEPDPLWSQALPNKWVNGQVGGNAVDSHDNLWVFHRPATIAEGEKAASLNPPQAESCIPAPPVLEFDPNGKFVQAWRGPGRGCEWVTS